MQVIAVNGVPLFFAQRDDVWFPTLRLLHQYPDMMPKLRVDTGAIKFVLSGANIMCPGLTSKGATMHDEVYPLTLRLSSGLLLTLNVSFLPVSCAGVKVYVTTGTPVLLQAAARKLQLGSQ